MNRQAIKQHNAKVIMLVDEFMQIKLNQPYRTRLRMGYKELAGRLNAKGILSSRCNRWTFRSLYRMMQRNRVRLCDIQRL